MMVRKEMSQLFCRNYQINRRKIMLGKERLDKILMPVEKLLRKGAPWGEVINAGVKASQQLQIEIILALPYKMPRLLPDKKQ